MWRLRQVWHHRNQQVARPFSTMFSILPNVWQPVTAVLWTCLRRSMSQRQFPPQRCWIWQARQKSWSVAPCLGTPDVEFHDRLVLNMGDRTLELRNAPVRQFRFSVTVRVFRVRFSIASTFKSKSRRYVIKIPPAKTPVNLRQPFGRELIRRARCN